MGRDHRLVAGRLAPGYDFVREDVVTSALFAGAHLVAHDPALAAATFFPSIVFGYFRGRCGSIGPGAALGGAIVTCGLSLLGEAALKKGTADPHPCQTAAAGGSASKASQEEVKPQREDEGGVLGWIRRMFK